MCIILSLRVFPIRVTDETRLDRPPTIPIRNSGPYTMVSDLTIDELWT